MAEPGWRVLVVDDSIVVRAAVRAILAERADVAMVETARCARSALSVLERAAESEPIDVVLLDVEMPAMSGIEALPHLLAVSPTTRVVMASSLTRRGAAVTMAALAAGAADYLCKPRAAEPRQQETFRDELAAKVAIWGAHARRGRQGRGQAPQPATSTADPAPRKATGHDPGRPAVAFAPRPRTAALAIGCSTGGPQALLQLFASVTLPVRCPVFITQHMPPAFTAMLAEQIGRLTGGACREAQDGETVAAGRIYLAPGDHHLLVTAGSSAQPVIRLSREAPENFCRPAVDPMLKSLAGVYGDGLCAAILTGMGQDGLAGCRELRRLGGQVIVQDEASSVVWGMPGAVARAGLADEALPLAEIAAWLCSRIGGGRKAA